MTKSFIAAGVLVLAFASAASAQGGPTPAQQAACRGDAMKFCASNVGKPEQMLACLRSNKAQLSASCAQVIDAVN